jgi:hypothetical protein
LFLEGGSWRTLEVCASFSRVRGNLKAALNRSPTPHFAPPPLRYGVAKVQREPKVANIHSDLDE